MILGFFIAGAQMGSELSTSSKPGLAFNRHLTGYIAGSAPLKEVILFRNGKPFQTLSSKESHLEFALDDSEHISSCALSSPDDRPPFLYYYLRVLQSDGHAAWSSPIWVDLAEGEALSLPKKKKKNA